MIHLIANALDAPTAAFVLAALRRSVSHDLAIQASHALLENASIVVCVNANDRLGDALVDWLNAKPRKLILFGRLPVALHHACDATFVPWPADASSWSRSPSARAGGWAQSSGEIRYRDAAAIFGASGWHRPLERFDFTDEWNNLGYGAIRADGSAWALAEPVRLADATVLADLYVEGKVALSYCALFDVGVSSVLWVNRPVGTIDSFEWRVIERFLSDWRCDDLPCSPVISEIPWGYDSAITTRLDCDEDITSARALWEAYSEWGVPLSLAIHTSNLADDTHHSFLHEFCANAGTLLSHTATHAPNWGGSYEAALKEGSDSLELIRTATGVSVRYAVSPFHQSPPYALAALCDAGYCGCIGGIIRNDPEFLMARGGELANMPRGFIGHSQQTMLHGDCMLIEGDPLRIFKAAYDRAYETRTLFGYLDHPFSPRYQYGWIDETQRIEAHRGLIGHIRARAKKPLFLDEIQALDFLRERAAIQMAKDDTGYLCHRGEASRGLVFGVEYKGRCEPLLTGKRLG